MAGQGFISFPRTEKYSAKLADNIITLRNEKALMDFKICVKDDTIPCSKFVMAAHSPMLRAMLTSDMAEVAKQEIRLDQIDVGIIQIILDYMYCEDVSFNKDQLMALITASDYLQMTELKEMCLNEVPAILEPANVITWWKEAGNMNYDSIQDRCEEIIAANFNQISQQTDFLNLSIAEMQHYVSNVCKDSVKADDVLDAVMKWIAHDKAQQEYLEDLLHNVQLNKCSAESIKSVLQTYETLLDSQPMMYKLLCNTLADISTALMASCKIEAKMVVVGGQYNVNEANLVCWEVNEGFRELYNIPPKNIGNRSSVCKTPTGFAITGGVGINLCCLFVASSKQWIRMQNMLTKRQIHGSVCVKNVLYVLGGSVGETNHASSSVHSIDIANGNWQKEPALPLTVQCPNVSDVDESLYLFDADDSGQLLQMNITEKIWRKRASPPNGKRYTAVTMISALDRLFVAGGESMICAWYIPETDTWCTGQQPLREHWYGALTHINRKLLLLGGYFIDGGTNAVEEYDIDDDKWTVCNHTMPRNIFFHQAFMLDNRVP